jgi:membrane-associated two-gene conflict system component 1 (EACC1)
MSDGGQLQRILDVRLELQADPESDPQDQELAVRRLRRELSELDSAVVRPATGPSTPPGSKATDPVTIGAIVLALSASGGVFVGIVETVKDWLGRQADRHRITLTVDGDSIELTRASAEEREALIEAFVRRHSAG